MIEKNGPSSALQHEHKIHTENEKKKNFWTPTKIALAALGSVTLLFILYRGWNHAFNNPHVSTQKSKVCSLPSIPYEEQIKIIAEKLKVAFQKYCPDSDDTLVQRIDHKISQIGTQGDCLSLFTTSDRCKNSLESQSALRSLAKSIIPTKNEHPTIDEMASSCTTEEGLLTEDRFNEVTTANLKSNKPLPDVEQHQAYERYVSRMRDFCHASSEYLRN